ncbi:hypothetical protein CF70_002010 [Cupriavidus sp. SK-3]|nr:hypothetical protein CF70_002010 [Cupriavidus sp. SK-3]
MHADEIHLCSQPCLPILQQAARVLGADPDACLFSLYQYPALVYPVLQLLRALCEDGSGTQPRFDLTQPSDEPPVRARAFIVQAWVADRAAMA